MRQLWLTGWMQQSIRMVCAAFLTEYLNMHWVHGEVRVRSHSFYFCIKALHHNYQ